MLLITGATGQLGQAFAADWINKDIICLDKDACDITDKDSIQKSIDTYTPTAIINCAAYTDVKNAETPEGDISAQKINHDGVHNLCEIASNGNVPLIHISTDYVFDGKAHTPYKTKHTPNPINAYGQSKLAGENVFLDSDVHGAIIRVSHLSSPYGNNIIKTFHKLLSNLNEITVVADQRICMTYAHDVLGFVQAYLKQPIDGKQIYHLGSSNDLSFYDLAIAIKNHIQSDTIIHKTTLAEFEKNVQKPLYSVLDVSDANTIYTCRPWQDGLKDVLEGLA